MKNILSNESNKSKQINKLYLNGPVNYIKLKKNEKEVYIFFDIHKNITHQKKCEEYEAKDIDKFLYKTLKETKETIDFFFEVRPTNINIENTNKYNGRYIDEVVKMFKKLYKEISSGEKLNIRLHYIDIRDYAFINMISDTLYQIHNIVNSHNIENIEMVNHQLKYIIELLEKINNLIYDIVRNPKQTMSDVNKINLVEMKLENNKDKSPSTPYDINYLGLKKLLEKIMLKYTNNKDKEIISNYLKENYLINSENLIILIKKIIEDIEKFNLSFISDDKNEKLIIKNIYLDQNKKLSFKGTQYGVDWEEYNNFFTKLTTMINNIDVYITTIGCVFMDTFFLRRIIEKKYINKSIVYTGAYHSAVYVWFLVKYYSFEIDDYSYINLNLLNKKSPLKDLEKKILKSKNPNDIIEYLWPDKFIQCVSINKF